MSKYAIVVSPLSDEDGGGYVAVFPDLPGCISDGDTPQEAIINAQDALAAWLSVQADRGVSIPSPGDAAKSLDAKIQHLLDAIKSLADFTEHQETHIEFLEETLETTIENLKDRWHLSGAVMSAQAKLEKLPRIH